jgi:hypothetical protein
MPVPGVGQRSLLLENVLAPVTVLAASQRQATRMMASQTMLSTIRALAETAPE